MHIQITKGKNTNICKSYMVSEDEYEIFEMVDQEIL